MRGAGGMAQHFRAWSGFLFRLGSEGYTHMTTDNCLQLWVSGYLVPSSGLLGTNYLWGTWKQNTQTQNKNTFFSFKGQNIHWLSVLDVLIYHINIFSGHKHKIIFIVWNEINKCWYLLVWGFFYYVFSQRPRPIFVFKSYLGGQLFWENILRCYSLYKNQSLSWLELTAFTAPPINKFPTGSRSFPKAPKRTIQRKLS